MNIRFLHKTDLILDPWHPARGRDEGVLRIVATNVIVDAELLREDPDAKIITNEPEAVCRVLGIPFPDKQVVQERS